jgi:hypothetical protein
LNLKRRILTRIAATIQVQELKAGQLDKREIHLGNPILLISRTLNSGTSDFSFYPRLFFSFHFVVGGEVICFCFFIDLVL